MQDKLYLGNLDAQRDWGFAGDYVDAMWRMLQQENPDGIVVSTGKMAPVCEFCRLSSEHGLNAEDYIEIDPRYPTGGGGAVARRLHEGQGTPGWEPTRPWNSWRR